MSLKEQKENITVGGQAVIEGVMMRSPHAISVAVRKRSGEIVLKKTPFVSWTKRWRLLNLPIFRGAVVLIESIVLGISALSFSGDVALEEENQKKQTGEDIKQGQPKKMSGIYMGIMVVISFAIGLLLFFYLPLLLTDLIGVKSGFWFNMVDGTIRLLIFLIYLFAITLLKDIRRLFEYHGAEHKSIFTYENHLDLTVNNTSSFKTFHPRCGTSFLLIVMIVSILVFVFLGRPETIADRLIRFLFIPVIGGISYELIRLSGKYSGNPLATCLIAPGLWLQRITTKEPDAAQLEVALVALKSALSHEFSQPVQIVKTET